MTFCRYIDTRNVSNNMVKTRIANVYVRSADSLIPPCEKRFHASIAEFSMLYNEGVGEDQKVEGISRVCVEAYMRDNKKFPHDITNTDPWIAGAISDRAYSRTEPVPHLL